ncbi:hypothetical protein NIES3804_08790 [Microcystis aeruginosa NIES-3804]|uniref:Uncharacterized protein n=1 Tax=Microcystis aeruginosa NIES-3804 TaxID=2517783 RepID=A0A6H9GQ09_MICAE|nr:hypothetical protein NIES3804_08790 [Microcystis aeruginosa NIES-3804]
MNNINYIQLVNPINYPSLGEGQSRRETVNDT